MKRPTANHFQYDKYDYLNAQERYINYILKANEVKDLLIEEWAMREADNQQQIKELKEALQEAEDRADYNESKLFER